MNIIYLTGELSAKRRLIRSKAQSDVTADNDDILGYFKLSGKLYCLPGTLPFSDMSVRSFVAYKRSLQEVGSAPMKDREIKCYLGAVGLKIRLRKKIKSLSRIEYRHLLLACSYKLGATSAYVNFDGLSYSLAARRELNGMLAALSRKFNVYVAVSDSRFIPRGASVRKVTSDGMQIAAATKQRSKTVSRRVLGKFFRTSPVFFGLDSSLLQNPVLIK